MRFGGESVHAKTGECQESRHAVKTCRGGRYRANIAHIRLSRPDSGPGFEIKILKSLWSVLSSLRSGSARCLDTTHGSRVQSSRDSSVIPGTLATQCASLRAKFSTLKVVRSIIYLLKVPWSIFYLSLGRWSKDIQLADRRFDRVNRGEYL